MSVFKCFRCQRHGGKRKECTIEVDGIDLEKRMVNCPLVLSQYPEESITAKWELVE